MKFFQSNNDILTKFSVRQCYHLIGVIEVTVYVDVLLTVNLYVNYLLLLCTSKIVRFKPKNLRILLSAAIGSAYGLIIFVPDLPKILSAVLKLTVSVVMIFICFGFVNFRRSVRYYLTFCAVNFSFAGIMYLLWTAVAPIGMYFCNGVAYFDIKLKTLAISTVVCFIIISIINFFISKKAPQSCMSKVIIFKNNQSVELTGLNDTGNSLRESFSSYPVFIAELSSVKKIAPQAVRDYFDGNTIPDKSVRFVVLNTVSGNGLSPAFKPDRVIIKSLSKNIAVKNVYIAVVNRSVGNGEYQIILNTSVLEEAENNAEALQHNP